jgi:hypothetical protein
VHSSADFADWRAYRKFHLPRGNGACAAWQARFAL